MTLLGRILLRMAVGVAAVAVVGLAFWLYGDARFDAGYALARSQLGEAAARHSAELARARRESAERIATLESRLAHERRQHHATIERLRAENAQFRVWHDALLPAGAVELIWLPDDAPADRGWLPGGPRAAARPRAPATADAGADR